MKFKDRENTYLPVVAKAFVAEGLPPELGAAIARQESLFDPTVVTMTGGDGRRGGSYGLCQMSLQTAIGLDRQATSGRLLDAGYNVVLAARLCKKNWGACHGRVEDVVSMYNSGRPFFRAPDSTKLIYVPHVVQFMAEYKERCASFRLPASLSGTDKTPAP